uniref:ATPase subunit 8 n=1 Tax=Ascidiella aspersa TaxID=201961 RepID=S0DFF8_9ASCI|nr:ATP synthase F0 subunit 8 [Ascidiella aspersa]CCO25811.1 ATPase subunit 8 [Ascidiella aspersa]
MPQINLGSFFVLALLSVGSLFVFSLSSSWDVC